MPGPTSTQELATGDSMHEACRAATPDTAQRRAGGQRWADLRTGHVIGRILRHLGLSTGLPVARPARARPLLVAAG